MNAFTKYKYVKFCMCFLHHTKSERFNAAQFVHCRITTYPRALFEIWASRAASQTYVIQLYGKSSGCFVGFYPTPVSRALFEILTTRAASTGSV